MSEMFEHVPAHMSALLVGDVEALAAAIDESINLGGETNGLARDGFNLIARQTDWYDEGLQLDLARQLVLAFHEPTDHAVLVMDSAPVQVPTLSASHPYRLDQDAHLHQLDTAFIVTTEEGPWQPPTETFDMSVTWPEAAPYLDDAIGWAYLSEPELVREFDREAFHRLSMAGISRGLVVLGADNSLTFVADTSQESAEEFLGLIQASASASTASEIPQPIAALHVQATMSEITVTPLSNGAVAVQLPSPHCGGLIQQFLSAAAVGALWYSAEDHGRATAAYWAPDNSVRSNTCELGGSGAELAWDALRLAPDEEIPVLGALIDTRTLAAEQGRSLGGLAPYVLDSAAFEAAVEDADLGAIILSDAPFGVVVSKGDYGTQTALVASEPIASAMGLETSVVAGVGSVAGEAPNALDESASYPNHWAQLRSATPPGATAVCVANAALLRDAVSEIPSMFHGAFTNALTESAGVVFALTDDRQLVLRIHGIPPSSADAVGTNLAAMATDVVDISDHMLPSEMRPIARAFAAAIEVTDFETGVEVRLGVDSEPLLLILVGAGLVRAPFDLVGQPTSMPTSMPMPPP